MSGSRLLQWFATNARALPWRTKPRDPYRVVVSELMLQQTRVDRVAPRFVAFLERFPTFEALASSSSEDVVEAWSGLGYYRRARWLHRLAVHVVEQERGRLPSTAGDLERLPGIGPYTAAAVASMAFGERVAVLDGNVLRVGARVLALDADPRTRAGAAGITAWVEEMMAGHPPGVVNEALMELGATVCTPTSPDCPRCPIAGGCRARLAGDPERYPPARARRRVEDHRWVAACCVGPDGRWLLRRVDEGPILRGLWLPPFVPIGERDDPARAAAALSPAPLVGGPEVLAAVRHAITHRRISVVPVRLPAAAWRPTDGWRWVDPRQPRVATSSLLSKILDRNEMWFQGRPE